jgi:hypothetical protein
MGNSQGNTEEKEQYWRHHDLWLQTILQSHNNQNSMVWVQKQIWRPIEQNKRSRFESRELCTSVFWQRCQKRTMEIRMLQCSSDLPFLYGQGCWTFLHMFISHLCFCFWELSVQFICLFIQCAVDSLRC